MTEKIIRIGYHPKASETIKTLVKVAKEKFNIRCELYKDINPRNLLNPNNIPVLLYGKFDEFEWSKTDTLIEMYEEDIIKNTLYEDTSVINDYDCVLMKNPTRVVLWKDIKADYEYDDGVDGLYRWIKNKTEWRINYSFGKINNIFNKNLQPNDIFGKAELTNWTPEQDKKIRGKLIELTRNIASHIEEHFPLVEHFGADIIRDNDTGEYYLLEINRAHSLNEEPCYLFLKGWLEKYKSEWLGGGVGRQTETQVDDVLTKTQTNNSATSQLSRKQELIKKITDRYVKELSNLNEELLMELDEDTED